MTTRYPKLAAVLKEKSLKWGQFTLSSGRTSNYYIDGRLTSFDPLGAATIADAVLEEIKDLRIDAIGGMDMGATPIVGAVACRSHFIGRPIPTFVVRKEVKAYGTKKPIEGWLPPPPSKVVMVDDVITTGDSLMKAIDAAEAAGCEVVLAISILDRGAGAIEAMAKRGIKYSPLVTLMDIGVVDGQKAE